MFWHPVAEKPAYRGFYLCALTQQPPQSHWLDIIEWRDGQWLTSWAPSHWMPLPDNPNAN